MKILYHHRTASRDGQAVHIDELVAALRARGHEVRVVAPSTSEGRGMGENMGWVHILKRSTPKAAYELMELGYSLFAYRRLSREIADFQPDIIYERYNLYLLAGVLASRRRKLPLLLEVNGPVAYERELYGGLAWKRLSRWAEAFAWRGGDVVLPVTRVLAQFVERAGVRSEDIHVIPNGDNRAHFSPVADTGPSKRRLGLDDRLVLGFTGFVRDWHGVDRVLRWMAQADSPSNAYLLIVGDGPHRAALEMLAKRLCLEGRVHFTGVVERARVPEYMSAFDVALQPAVVPYASPLKLMEYLALGKAIVAPLEPNLLEILEHDVNAWMFDRRDDGALAAALTRVCADSALRSRLATAAHQTIDRLGLTWEANAARVESLALKLLHRRRSPHAREVVC
jgi:glycosyltransferase involved in cell wall biosynthesis